MGWTCNGVPQDGQVYNSGFPHDPVENPDSSNICFKCELPRSAVQTGHSQPGGTGSGTTSNRSLVPWLAGLVFFILASGGMYGTNTYLKSRSTSSPTPETTSSPIVDSSPTSPINEVTPPPETPVLSEDLQAKISSGDRPLFKDASYAQRDDGIIAFSKGDYNLALQRFEEAVLSTPNQPEPEIYLNNTKARIAGNPYAIAAVVPITKSTDQAKEMLRGIADAQRLFNDRGGANDRLLEVIISDDENDPTIARQVAQTLVDSYKNELLAIIGHNSSDVSASALEVYEKSKIAMISPTSTSTKLSGSTFFRTVASDAKSGEVLADYINRNFKTSSVGLFYVSSSSYSTSLYEAFSQNFRGQVQSYDFADSNLDPEEALNFLETNGIDTILLFPNVSQRDRALGIAKLAKQRNQSFNLFGGDALYTAQTLLEGQSAVEGMILVVPWFAEGDYAETAEKRWHGQVSWRTATSYDATQAVITVLESSSQRVQTSEEVVQRLYQPDFTVPQELTSGESVFFDKKGNRKISPILVEIKTGVPSPMGTTLGFQPIP
jgi:branched-chain amino acid transport system substrate-binding protein